MIVGESGSEGVKISDEYESLIKSGILLIFEYIEDRSKIVAQVKTAGWLQACKKYGFKGVHG
jgi:hypothetical protein